MRSIENLNAEHVKERFSSEKREENIIDEHFILVRQSDVVTRRAILGQPMRLAECRFLHVLQGHAEYRIGMIDHTLRRGDVVIMPPDTIVEVVGFSDDFASEVLAVIDLPGIDHEAVGKVLSSEITHLSLEEEHDCLIRDYFSLIDKQMRRSSHSSKAISHIVLSMAADLYERQQELTRQLPVGKRLRGEDIMSRFIALLRQYGIVQRNIAFFAERLAVTPNHLSDVVRQQSGMSVMDWLHRATITEAKVLLKHSDLMIYEISDRLNFPEATAFNRYFKRCTGLTPLEYRNQ